MRTGGECAGAGKKRDAMTKDEACRAAYAAVDDYAAGRGAYYSGAGVSVYLAVIQALATYLPDVVKARPRKEKMS